jgi:hypothetical protein
VSEGSWVPSLYLGQLEAGAKGGVGLSSLTQCGNSRFDSTDEMGEKWLTAA